MQHSEAMKGCSIGSDEENLQEGVVREHGYYAAAQCACTTTLAIAEVHAKSTWGEILRPMSLTCHIMLLALFIFTTGNRKCRKLTDMESFCRRAAHNPLQLIIPFDQWAFDYRTVLYNGASSSSAQTHHSGLAARASDRSSTNVEPQGRGHLLIETVECHIDHFQIADLQ